MTYDEAIAATVSRAEALSEVRKHGIAPAEFLEEVGDKPEYTGKEVLDWLGY